MTSSLLGAFVQLLGFQRFNKTFCLMQRQEVVGGKQHKKKIKCLQTRDVWYVLNMHQQALVININMVEIPASRNVTKLLKNEYLDGFFNTGYDILEIYLYLL